MGCKDIKVSHEKAWKAEGKICFQEECITQEKKDKPWLL